MNVRMGRFPVYGGPLAVLKLYIRRLCDDVIRKHLSSLTEFKLVLVIISKNER